MQVEFGDEIFFFEFIHYLNLTVSRSGASFLRTFNSNLHVATSVCLRRPRRLLPTSGVRILRSLPACVRRNKAQDPSCPCPTRGLVGGSCRCAPPPDSVCRPPPQAQLARTHSPHPSQDRARLPRREATRPGGFKTFSFQRSRLCPLCMCCFSYVVSNFRVSVSLSSRFVPVSVW